MCDQVLYVWRWGTCGGKYPKLGLRKGQKCRMIAKGAMNSAHIEFEDGEQFIASRNGLAKAQG